MHEIVRGDMDHLNDLTIKWDFIYPNYKIILVYQKQLNRNPMVCREKMQDPLVYPENN